MEINELNRRAMGGTELMAKRLEESLPKELLDKFQIICSRIRTLDPNKKRILWLHDLPNDPESACLKDKELLKQFSAIVFCSNWQYEQYSNFFDFTGINTVVINNGIKPIDVSLKDKTNPKDGIKLIYHTTPHRGLSVLLPVFLKLQEKYNITLDVYSSFKIYGWEERDKEYQDLFDICRNHDKIQYHGTVSNQEIREALKKTHIFAYPCIWPETSCLSVIEAMSAMNMVVTTNLAVLPETTGRLVCLLPVKNTFEELASGYEIALESIIQKHLYDYDSILHVTSCGKQYIDAIHNWNTIREYWKFLLEGILERG